MNHSFHLPELFSTLPTHLGLNAARKACFIDKSWLTLICWAVYFFFQMQEFTVLMFKRLNFTHNFVQLLLIVLFTKY